GEQIVLSAEAARQGEIILRKRWQRLIFIAGAANRCLLSRTKSESKRRRRKATRSPPHGRTSTPARRQKPVRFDHWPAGATRASQPSTASSQRKYSMKLCFSPALRLQGTYGPVAGSRGSR